MDRTIFLDLETIPTIRPDVIADIRASIKPPATYKKEESIKAWLEENIEAETAEAVRKTALDGAYGRVCVVGIAIDDQPAKALHLGNEMGLLTKLSDELDKLPVSEWYSSTVVGHNVLAFDLRFLMQRYIVHGIKPHAIIKRAAQAKPWESEKVFDTMTQWAGVGNRISLDKLCKVLGVSTPKGEITGANVWDYYQAGKIEEVAEYCKKDVEATRDVYRRMTFA